MKRPYNCLIIISAIAFMVSCSASDDSPPSARKKFNDYNVNVQHSGELTVCQVTFNSTPPTSDIAAEIVHHAVESLVKEDGSREILGMAFDASGEALPETQYGGALTYKPSDRQILTMDQRDGRRTAEGDEVSYYIRMEESRTAQGITPVRKWLDLSIVFAARPSNSEIKPAVQKEISKLKARGLDVNVYIFVGDKSNKISWKQVKASNGKYMGVDYSAKTGKIIPNWNWD